MTHLTLTKPNVVPVFFAVDDRYVPFLYVALRSLIDHASDDHHYRIHILIDQLSEENRQSLSTLSRDNVEILFTDVTGKLRAICDRLHIRDYYSKTTYYRFFIPSLFPQYERGVYLDCDIVLNRDVADLYHVPMGTSLVSAIVEEVISDIDVFGKYSEEVLHVSRNAYFNAGILVMNLAEMRRICLEEQFVRLLGRRTYRVAQDQDYLNVLCRDRVTLLSKQWNKTPMPGSDETVEPYIVHYKINFKPWRYDDIPYAEYFWKYAERTPYADFFRNMKDTYSEEEKSRDKEQYDNLEALAASQTHEALTLADGELASFGRLGEALV